MVQTVRSLGHNAGQHHAQITVKIRHRGGIGVEIVRVAKINHVKARGGGVQRRARDRGPGRSGLGEMCIRDRNISAQRA